MASLAGIKLNEEGTSSFATNCFPVRHFSSVDDEAGGAWYVSHRAEQRRRFKAVLCTKPRTYSRIKEERKKSELEGKSITECKIDAEDEEEDEGPILDGFFLMKHCCVEDPSDLCSVNISGQGFTEVKEEDLALFDNVAYVNAAENYLPFEAFKSFPILRELEVPLNGLRSLQIKHTDYITLELLDLSYNNLSQDDILLVGTLPHLKVLHLTGNGFTNIPHDLCLPFIPEGRKSQYPRFPYLEVLMLDDNKLSDINIFAAMAGLQRLKHLNLEKNQIFFVPQLKSVRGEMKPDEKSPRKKRKTPRDGRSSRRSKSRSSSANIKQSSENIADATQQGEGTEGQDGQGEVTSKSGAIVETMPVDIKVEDEELNEAKKEVMETQDPLISSKNELLDEDFQLSLGDLSARINDLNLEAEINPQTPSTTRKPDVEPVSKIAFPELRYLSLAYNQICNEEALLAVAAWPMLSELVFHDNPLTTEHVGDPPLLKRFLHDRLGIKLVRKRVAPSIKKHVLISDKPSRRVKTQVPKIPRPSVEQRLMLEAPQPPPPGLMKDAERPSTSGHKSPLPPINKQERSASAGALPRQQQEADVGPSDAWSSDVEEELESDTFFMTQVDDQEEEKDSRPPTKLKPTKPIDKRYHGYEALFDGDDEVELEEDNVSQDIQTNVRALRYALNHQLVYRDTKSLQLRSVKKPVKAYRRHPLPPPEPKPTKEEKIESILENLKNRTTVDEASLKQVLKNKRLKHKFPEAETLLAQIQHRYNAVRVTSMKEAKDARKAVQDTLSDISRVSKRSGVKVSH